MFPLPWNKPYRKKNGALTIIDDMFVDPGELQDEIDALDARLDIDESVIDDIANSVTPISQTGTEATVVIASGKYFYLDGALVKAKTAIAIGDTFTEGTNYEAVTAGGLNDLFDGIDDLDGRLDDAETAISKVSNKYLLCGSSTVTLATADGVKSVGDLFNDAIIALQSLVASSVISGATHMRILYINFPYNVAGTIYTAVPLNGDGLTIRENYSNVTSLRFGDLTYNTSTDNIRVGLGNLSASVGGSKFTLQDLKDATYTDTTSNVPPSGAKVEIRLDLYYLDT